jgi:CubicO group peptidase (beta-lactamase class C family)
VTSQVDGLMADYHGTVPGACVLVVLDGNTIVHAAYGQADLEERIATTPGTNFRLASVTKQFTAAAVLLLLEDGRLGLDDCVREWLPSLPQSADAITLRHLLTHTSGLIDYEDAIPATLERQLHDKDVLQILETQDRTYFAPGSAYRYSNSGYALLALVVEVASSMPFAAFLKTRIFEPLRMRNTVAHQEGVSTVAHRAFGYSKTPWGNWERTDQSQTSAVLGDGGIYSSIDDLGLWDAALYDERLLRRTSLEAAFKPATSTDDPRVRYGFGWRITEASLWHSGETRGFRNVIVRYPQQRLSVVILTNRNDPEPYGLARSIARLCGAPE